MSKLGANAEVRKLIKGEPRRLTASSKIDHTPPDLGMLRASASTSMDVHVSTYYYYGRAFGGRVTSANYPGGKKPTSAYVEIMLSC